MARAFSTEAPAYVLCRVTCSWAMHAIGGFVGTCKSGSGICSLRCMPPSCTAGPEHVQAQQHSTHSLPTATGTEVHTASTDQQQQQQVGRCKQPQLAAPTAMSLVSAACQGGLLPPWAACHLECCGAVACIPALRQTQLQARCLPRPWWQEHLL